MQLVKTVSLCFATCTLTSYKTFATISVFLPKRDPLASSGNVSPDEGLYRGQHGGGILLINSDRNFINVMQHK